MKKIILLTVVAMATFAQAQITKVHSFNQNVQYAGNLNFYKIDEGMLYAYDTQNAKVSLYNTDFTLYKEANLTLPSGYSVTYVGYLSKGVLSTNGTYDFFVTSMNTSADMDKRMHLGAYNENGQLIYDFGYGTSANAVIYAMNNNYYAFVWLSVLNDLNMYDYTTDIYKLNGSVSAVQQVPQTSAHPYPNPANGIINLPYQLHEQVGSMYICDSNGKQIERKHISNSQDYLQLNVANYPAGQYFYTIEGITHTFIVY